MTIRFSFGWKAIVTVLSLFVVLLISVTVSAEYYTGQPEAKFKGLRDRFAYLADPEAPVPVRLKFDDETCLRSGCHGNDKFQDKEIKFTEKVTFTHKVHFEKPIEGLTLHCDSCHFKQSRKKHFEVTKETCFLCHFKATKPKDGKNSNSKPKLNEGRSKCDLCHTIPTKSLQRQLSTDDPNKKPITHQTIEKANVPCQGCHFQLVKGMGEVTKEGCRDCHNQGLDKRGDKTLMHEKHVATQRATCFDCHRTIRHMAEGDFLDDARTSCLLCHPDQHRFQKLLLLGEERAGVSATPGLMSAVKTNCMACHIDKTHKNGQPLMKGTGKACVGCHTPKHEDMAEDWKNTLAKEVKFAKELEEEALQAIANAEGKIAGEKLAEAKAMLEKGRGTLHIVEFGNGVHNKKYSVMLLDAAMTSFEDLIDSLAAGG